MICYPLFKRSHAFTAGFDGNLHAFEGGSDGDTLAWGVAFDAAGNLLWISCGIG